MNLWDGVGLVWLEQCQVDGVGLCCFVECEEDECVVEYDEVFQEVGYFGFLLVFGDCLEVVEYWCFYDEEDGDGIGGECGEDVECDFEVVEDEYFVGDDDVEVGGWQVFYFCVVGYVVEVQEVVEFYECEYCVEEDLCEEECDVCVGGCELECDVYFGIFVVLVVVWWFVVWSIIIIVLFGMRLN